MAKSETGEGEARGRAEGASFGRCGVCGMGGRVLGSGQSGSATSERGSAGGRGRAGEARLWWSGLEVSLRHLRAGNLRV